MSKYQQQIENEIALRGTMTVAELSELLGVSDQTIRRIVKPLEESGKVQKVHGAIKSVENPMTAPFQIRMLHNRRAKAELASKLVELIEDGQSLAIDTGSTAGFVAQALKVKRNLTIVTNSAYVASTLSMKPGNRVFMAGTQLRDHDGASFDRTAFATIERMQVDTCILTVGQVHPERGFLVNEQCEADIAKAMSAIADRTIFAIDHSKFLPAAAVGMVKISGLASKPEIVTDLPLSKSFRGLLKEADLIVAKPG